MNSVAFKQENIFKLRVRELRPNQFPYREHSDIFQAIPLRFGTMYVRYRTPQSYWRGDWEAIDKARALSIALSIAQQEFNDQKPPVAFVLSFWNIFLYFLSLVAISSIFQIANPTSAVSGFTIPPGNRLSVKIPRNFLILPPPLKVQSTMTNQCRILNQRFASLQ